MDHEREIRILRIKGTTYSDFRTNDGEYSTFDGKGYSLTFSSTGGRECAFIALCILRKLDGWVGFEKLETELVQWNDAEHRGDAHLVVIQPSISARSGEASKPRISKGLNPSSEHRKLNIIDVFARCTRCQQRQPQLR